MAVLPGFTHVKTAINDQPPYPLIQAKVLPKIIYSAEHWQQMNDSYVKSRRPFLRYVCARTPLSHPGHVEKHSLVYPIDHPFWDTWMVPNSFACLCDVMSVSEDELERSQKEPDGYTWRTEVPFSEFEFPTPDPGFDFNPGKLVAQDKPHHYHFTVKIPPQKKERPQVKAGVFAKLWKRIW